MTMPHERTRSLRWAFEVLQEVRGDAMANDGDRARAAELLVSFPTPTTVLEWIQSDAPCLPVDAALAIEGAGDLLRSIYRSETCPPKLRHNVMFALRHFPERASAQRWTRGSAALPIRTWLLPEDVYD
jgi:hypothetical protein